MNLNESVKDYFKTHSDVRKNSFLNAMMPTIGFTFISKKYGGISIFDKLSVSSCQTTEKTNSMLHSVKYFYQEAGVEFDIVYEMFKDTGVIEISGFMRNVSEDVIDGVKGPFSMSLEFDLEKTGNIKMSHIAGGSSCSGSYPPPAYKITEADGAYNILGGIHGGRSTETEAPYVIITDTQGENGFFYVYEWPCRWILNNVELTRDGKQILWCLAHVAETEFDMNPGECVEIPKVDIGFFNGDMNRGSNKLRKHIVDHVRRQVKDGSMLPPVFYNHWFGLGNNFDIEILKKEADVYAELGCEYFVVDTGWHEGGFRAGIGNWELDDRNKFPHGMEEFADYVRALGMKFGTWLELEFAMKNSDWGKRHSDWFYAAPGRRDIAGHKKAFEEVLLKLDNESVRSSVLEFLKEFVKKYKIEWLRWDFNNSPAQFWDANETENEWGKLQIAYGSGLFKLMDDFMSACPQVHIEACAGGGHRMDLGTLRRAHSCWMSDNGSFYNAIRRYQINLNRFVSGNYPNSTFIWATYKHGAEFKYSFGKDGCPVTALRSKMAGPLGFSEQSHFFTQEALAFLKKEIAAYKSMRHLMMKDFYPLFSPKGMAEFDGWQFNDPEKSEGAFMVFRCEAPDENVRISLQGLEDCALYELTNIDSSEMLLIKGSEHLKIKISELNGTAWFRYQIKC